MYTKLTNSLSEELTTRPSSAEMTKAVTGVSCPVKLARGVGCSPSPTMA